MNHQESRYKQSELAIEEIVNRIISSGKMSRQDHILLTSIAVKNGEMSAETRRHINRIFDYIQTSRLKLVDW